MLVDLNKQNPGRLQKSTGGGACGSLALDMRPVRIGTEGYG